MKNTLYLDILKQADSPPAPPIVPVARRLMEREFLLGEEVKLAVLDAKSGGADG